MPCKSDKDCDENQVCNPDSGRCVSRSGAVGKKILAGRKTSPKKKAKKTSPKRSPTPSPKKKTKKAKKVSPKSRSPSPKRSPTPSPKKFKKMTKTDISKKTVKDLKAMLEEYNLTTSGKKAELVDRVDQYQRRRSKCCKGAKKNKDLQKCCETGILTMHDIKKLLRKLKEKPEKKKAKKISPKKVSPKWFEEEYGKQVSPTEEKKKKRAKEARGKRWGEPKMKKVKKPKKPTEFGPETEIKISPKKKTPSPKKVSPKKVSPKKVEDVKRQLRECLEKYLK